MSIFDSPGFSQRLFYPRPDHDLVPPLARDFFVTVEPGVRIHVRVHPNPSARAVLVHFHGNGEIVSDYDRLAARFCSCGVSFAPVEYRGYGRSTGTPSYRTCLEDAVTVVRAIDSELQSDENRGLPLIVMGRSLGSACAAEIAAANLPFVAGIVVESGAADLNRFASRRGYKISDVTEADRRDFCPLRKHARGRAPLLVLHAEEDKSIPLSEALLTLQTSGAEDRRLKVIPGTGHNSIMVAREYWEALATFVSEVTRPQGPQ